MPKMLEKVINARLGGRVERCHTTPHIGGYNNAMHQWGVAMLMYQLFPEDYAKLSIFCLTHDIAEAWVGDIPAPVRWAMPKVNLLLEEAEELLRFAHAGTPLNGDSLTQEDKAKIKACDILELYLWTHEQARMGNQYARGLQQNIESHIIKSPLIGIAQDFFKDIYSAADSLLPVDQHTRGQQCLATLTS